MKIISKYPVIEVGPKGARVVKNNKYEGGFDNTDGTQPPPTANPSNTSQLPTWLQDTLAVANSGVAQQAVDVAGKIKASKGGATVPPGANPPSSTGGPDGKGGKAVPSTGMSAGAKVGIALGVIGAGVVIYLMMKHKKKA